MSQINSLSNFSLEEIRSLVLEALKDSPQTQYENLCNTVARIAVSKQLVPNPRGNMSYSGGDFYLQSCDKDKVREIIWNLIIERIMTIGMNSSNPSWPFLRLTDYGQVVVQSTTPTPHDPSGYINRIKNEIPNIDPIILIYLEECLNTYNINALLSSTITLGCASEKALLLLIEAYTMAFQDISRKQKFINNTSGKMIKRQFEEFSKSITTIIGHIPSDVSDGLNTVLLGIFEMIRNNRNDAGHPTGKSISKEQAYANIQVFIPYCKKIYQLINYFNNNPI